MFSWLTGFARLSYHPGQAALAQPAASPNLSATLADYYLARQGGASSVAASNAPAAPWTTAKGAPSVSAAVQNVVNGQRFINPAAAD